MPKETFFHLPEEKRNMIIQAAVNEFSKSGYDTASINRVCRAANIAKGSFYQYFTDKLDLYVYIMTTAIEEKIRFFSDSLAGLTDLTMPEQFRLLFKKGVEFAKNHPQYAALGEQFAKENNEAARKAVIKEGNKQSELLFSQMIQNAKAKGEIDSKVEPLALNLLLQSVNSTVLNYMQNRLGSSDYEYHEDDINSFVDSLLNIILNGIRR